MTLTDENENWNNGIDYCIKCKLSNKLILYPITTGGSNFNLRTHICWIQIAQSYCLNAVRSRPMMWLGLGFSLWVQGRGPQNFQKLPIYSSLFPVYFTFCPPKVSKILNQFLKICIYFTNALLKIFLFLV